MRLLPRRTDVLDGLEGIRTPPRRIGLYERGLLST